MPINKNNMKKFLLLTLGILLFFGSYGLANADSCVYISSVTQWSPCSSGLTYAQTVDYSASTTILSSSPVCTALNVPVVGNCITPTCYDPNNSTPLNATTTLGTYTLSSNTYAYYSYDFNMNNSTSTADPYREYDTNNMTVTQISGKFSNAYNFSGTNSYIRYFSPALFQPSGQKTISLWVKPTGSTSGVILSEYRTDYSEGGYFIKINNDNQVSAGIKSDSWVGGATQGPVYTTPLSQSLSTTIWTPIAITIDTASTTRTISLYVDGSFVGKNTISSSGNFTDAGSQTPSISVPFLVGAEWYGPTNSICWSGGDCFYKGGIDDFFCSK